MEIKFREIKFRGMGIDGTFHYGNLSIIEKGFDHIKPGIYISNSAGAPFAYQVRPETVGQFTGLFDKKGKKIFEGDIVIYNHGDIDNSFEKFVSYVKYKSEDGKFIIERESSFNYSMSWAEILVIGNIHEKQSLLK